MRDVLNWLRRDPIGRFYMWATVAMWVLVLELWANGIVR